jgi:hypothetical protein
MLLIFLMLVLVISPSYAADQKPDFALAVVLRRKVRKGEPTNSEKKL